MLKSNVLRFLFSLLLALILLLITFFLVMKYFAPSPKPSNPEITTNSNIVSNKSEEIVSDKKPEKNEKLQAETDALLTLFGKMSAVPVFIKDEPILKTGSETQKGVAYTSCESNRKPAIYVKKIFYQNANQKMLVNILKHELTHAWFCQQGIVAEHDDRFRKKFAEAGGFGN